MNVFENVKNRPWQLVSRQKCHLCWAMQREVLAFLKDENLLEIIDIDAPESSQFLEKYDILVPVLLFEGQEVCHYHFDLSAAKAAAESAKKM